MSDDQRYPTPEPIVGTARLVWLLDAATHTPLRAGQVVAFYLAALTIYALPLILDNVLYIDDNLREMQAATWWKPEGRPLGDYLFNAVGVTPGTPDFFPLSMLLAILCMAVALTHLAFHWFRRPVLSQCLVLLPLWYNPFFLQELSYQYECLTLSLGVALVVLAVSLPLRAARWQVVVRGVLLAAALSLDQLPLNVFAGLACVDVLQRQGVPLSLRHVFKAPLEHLATLVVGGVFYYGTAYQILMNDRGGLVLPGFYDWGARIGLLAGKVGLFITPANSVPFALLLLAAIGGLVIVQARVLGQPGTAMARAGQLGVNLLAVAGMVLAVGGLLLFLYDLAGNADARVLVGVGPLLVGLSWLAYVLLERLTYRSTLLLAVPLAMCLSFSYVYGQYLRQQDALQTFVRGLVVADIFGHESLDKARAIYLLEDSNNDINNVFARTCVQRMLPALRYLAANDYQFLPEQLRKSGVDNMGGDLPSVPSLGEPVVARPFYAIYRVGEDAYIRFIARKTTLECPSLEGRGKG